MEGNLRFKIDWASRIVGNKFTVFALCLRAIFQVQAPWGAYIWRGDLTEGFLHYRIEELILIILILEGLIHGGLIFGILRYFSI